MEQVMTTSHCFGSRVGGLTSLCDDRVSSQLKGSKERKRSGTWLVGLGPPVWPRRVCGFESLRPRGSTGRPRAGFGTERTDGGC